MHSLEQILSWTYNPLIHMFAVDVIQKDFIRLQLLNQISVSLIN